MADCHDKPAHKRALASLVSLGLVQGLPPPNPRAIAEGDAQKMPRKARPIKAAKPPERRRQHRAARQLTPRQNMFLRDFFALWQRTVYARQTPDKSAVHEVIRRYQDLWP